MNELLERDELSKNWSFVNDLIKNENLTGDEQIIRELWTIWSEVNQSFANELIKDKSIFVNELLEHDELFS